MELVDLDLSAEEFDSLEIDALRQISQRNSLEKDAHLRQRRKLLAETKLSRAIIRKGNTIYKLKDVQEALKNKRILRKMDEQMGRPSPRYAAKGKTAAKGSFIPSYACRGDRENDGIPLWGLPTYFLFESASGYALFLAHGLRGTKPDYKSVENYISRFDQVFQLIAFHPFESADDALNQFNAVSRGIMSEQLKNFLVLNLPNPMEGGKPCYELALFDPCMGRQTSYETKIACSGGIFYDDIMRGMRMHLDKFIKHGDLEKAQLDLAHSYSRQRLNTTYEGKEDLF